MLASTLYKKLKEAPFTTVHVVLGNVFSEVFNRKPKNNEWILLRRFIKLYGAETVFWAILKSSHIVDDSNVFSYIARICSASINSTDRNGIDARLEEETKQRIEEMKSILKESEHG